jgi:hypothetical protein
VIWHRLTVHLDPILLCNELGADTLQAPSGPTHVVRSSGRTTTSVKEAVQIARDNNFMGLICSSRLLVSTTSLSRSRPPDLFSSPISPILPRMAVASRNPQSHSLEGKQHLTAWTDTCVGMAFCASTRRSICRACDSLRRKHRRSQGYSSMRKEDWVKVGGYNVFVTFSQLFPRGWRK